MQIEIQPETERLVREEISRGHFRSIDELITVSVRAWLEKNASSNGGSGSPAKNLVELFETSPFKGLNIEFERDLDYGRDVKL